MLNPFAQHLPAYSPLNGGALLSAVGAQLRRSPREAQEARRLISVEFAADAVALFDSGRSALQVAISLALGSRTSNRVVALPAFQCSEVAAAAIGADCRVALYDIDPVTLSPDLRSLELVLRQGVDVIVIAPLYGLPVDWDAITSLVDQYGGMVIEDAAQGSGARWRGRLLGSLGVLSVLSFGRGKGWTGGGGGALCMRGPFAGDRAQLLDLLPPPQALAHVSIVGATLLQWMIGRPSVYRIPASILGLGLRETGDHAPAPPTAPSTFSAALINRTLGAAHAEAMIRRRNGALWHVTLPKELLNRTPTVPSGSAAGYLRFPVRLTGNAAKLMRASQARLLGISRSYTVPLSRLDALAERLVPTARSFPGAEALVRELVTLPTHSRIGEKDREQIRRLCESCGAASTSGRVTASVRGVAGVTARVTPTKLSESHARIVTSSEVSK